MKQIHPVFYLWALFFPIFSVSAHPQNTLDFFKLTVPGTSSKNAATQLIGFDVLTQAPNSVVPLIELKDGKNQALAAPAGKKGSCYMHCMKLPGESKKSTHLYTIIEKNNSAVADNMPADNAIKNNHQSIIINNNLYENFE
jgi:hypothetical protein